MAKANKKLTELQEKLHVWRQRNFPNADATQQLLGVVEEVGELSHAHLKQIQGIRGQFVEHQLDKVDAVGDIAIYLLGYCSYEGIDFGDVLGYVSSKVMERDWVEYPKNGLTE